MWSALFNHAIQEDFEFLFKTVCRLWQSARKHMFACLQLFSELNDDGEGYSVWCCHTRTFVLLLVPSRFCVQTWAWDSSEKVSK